MSYVSYCVLLCPIVSHSDVSWQLKYLDSNGPRYARLVPGSNGDSFGPG